MRGRMSWRTMLWVMSSAMHRAIPALFVALIGSANHRVMSASTVAMMVRLSRAANHRTVQPMTGFMIARLMH